MNGIYLDKKAILERDLIAEAPVMLKSGVHDIQEIGAFSYTNGRIFSKNVGCIGRYCSIAPDVVLGHYSHPVNAISHHNVFYDFSAWSKEFHTYENMITDTSKLIKKNGKIIIGNDVWIGAHALILNGVTIGDGAIVGMGSVVTHDIPPFAIAAGNPAQIIRYRFSDKVIERLLYLKWWSYGPEILSNVELTDIETCIHVMHERIQGRISKYCGEKYCIDKVTHKVSKICRGK